MHVHVYLHLWALTKKNCYMYTCTCNISLHIDTLNFGPRTNARMDTYQASIVIYSLLGTVMEILGLTVHVQCAMCNVQCAMYKYVTTCTCNLARGTICNFISYM